MNLHRTPAPLLLAGPVLALTVVAALPAAAQTTAPTEDPSAAVPAASVAPTTAPSLQPAPAEPTPVAPAPAADEDGALALTYDTCNDLAATDLLTLTVESADFSDGGRLSRGETATTPLPPGTYEVRVTGDTGDGERAGYTEIEVRAGETTSLSTSMLCGPPVIPATDTSIELEEGVLHSILEVVHDGCPAYPGRSMRVSVDGVTDEGAAVSREGTVLSPGERVELTLVGGSYDLYSTIDGVGRYGTAGALLDDDEQAVVGTSMLCALDDGASDIPVPTRIETGLAAAGSTGSGGGLAATSAGLLVLGAAVAPRLHHRGPWAA